MTAFGAATARRMEALEASGSTTRATSAKSDEDPEFSGLVHPAGTGDSVCIVEASRICHSRPEISGPAFLARVGHRQSMTTDRQSKGRRSDAGTQGFTDSIVV